MCFMNIFYRYTFLWHFVKSDRIRSYSDPLFPAFGLNTSEYGYFSRSASETKRENFVAIAFHQNVNLRKDLPLSRWNLRVRESKNFWLYTLIIKTKIQLILRQYFKKSRWRSKCPPENLPCKSFFLKRRILINSFFTSQFNYCPLVWMFHSRTINNKINHVLERCLHILYSDKTSRIWVLCSKREKHFSWYRIIFIIYS